MSANKLSPEEFIDGYLMDINNSLTVEECYSYLGITQKTYKKYKDVYCKQIKETNTNYKAPANPSKEELTNFIEILSTNNFSPLPEYKKTMRQLFKLICACRANLPTDNDLQHFAIHRSDLYQYLKDALYKIASCIHDRDLWEAHNEELKSVLSYLVYLKK